MKLLMLQENMRTLFQEDVLLHMLVCVLTLSDELKVLFGIKKQGRIKMKPLHLNNVVL